jgi:hypothetical protein
MMASARSILINIPPGPVDFDGYRAWRETVHCDGSVQLPPRSSDHNPDSKDGLMVNVAAADDKL